MFLTLFSHDALHMFDHMIQCCRIGFFNADMSIYSIMLKTLHYLHMKAHNVLLLHEET